MTYESYRPGRRTTLDRINALIDFYERHAKNAGLRIEVNVTPLALARALGVEPERDEKMRVIEQSEFRYRGRTLVATGKPE